MLRFLQCCIFPRVICSEIDAVYCAEFVRALHITKTNDFQTIVFFDKVNFFIILNYIFFKKDFY